METKGFFQFEIIIYYDGTMFPAVYAAIRVHNSYNAEINCETMETSGFFSI